MLRALVIRQSRCRLQLALSTFDAMRCNCFTFALTTTRIIYRIQRREAGADEGEAEAQGGTAVAEVEADSISQASSTTRSQRPPELIIADGDLHPAAALSLTVDGLGVHVRLVLTHATPVTVPSPRSRVPCARRDFGDVACLQRSVVQWRRVHQLRVTARCLAAACRLQRSWSRALMSFARRLAAACRLQRSWRRALMSFRRALIIARLMKRALLLLQRRWRGLAAARFAADERDQCTGLFICQHQETVTFRLQKGSSYLVKGRRLGAGSFGDVIQPRKMNGDWRDYAVKVVSLQRVDSGDAANLLATEAHLLQLANAGGGHPNVLRMRAGGAFVVDCHVCVPLELAAAGDLRAYMRRLYKDHGKRMPQCEGLLCAKQIAAAVAFMHERGVAHRDLKLDNVLLMRPGHAVLGDFGLGVERSTLAGGLSNAPCGTLATMAPEVYGGRWHDPMAADVWSAGVTVVALVASHKDGDDSCGDYYPWSAPDAREISEYRWYETLVDDSAELRRSINAGLRSWPAEVPQPTAIGDLLRSSNAHSLPTGMPKELPPALLMMLDGMLHPDPNERITAAEVYSLHLVPLLE